MFYNIDLIAYHMKEQFPGIIVNIKQNAMVGRPIFPDKRTRNKKQIVVVDTDSIIHFVAHKEYPLVVYVGIRQDTIISVPCNYISLPEHYSMGEVFNALNGIFDELEAWTQELEHAVSNYLTYSSILNSCESLYDVPIALLDTQFRYVCFTKRMAYLSGFDRYVHKSIYLPLEDINYLNSLADYKSLEEKREVFHYVAVENLLHKNIFYRGEYVARLSIPYAQEEITNRCYGAILDILSQYIEKLYEQLGTFHRQEKREQFWKDIISELIAGNKVNQSSMEIHLREKGFRKEDSYLLVQFTSGFTNNNEDTARALASRLEMQIPGVACVHYDGCILALVNTSYYNRQKDDSFMQQLSYYLRDSLLQAGVSRAFTELTNIDAAYRQTQIALEYGTIKDPTLWCYRYNDYAFAHLIQYGCNGFTPDQICHPALYQLKDYDTSHNTELYATLKTYIELQYNASETARALFVNRSSFLKRMDRIEAVTGINLRDYPTRLYLAMSFHLNG